jgi:hypothetical protein
MEAEAASAMTPPPTISNSTTRSLGVSFGKMASNKLSHESLACKRKHKWKKIRLEKNSSTGTIGPKKKAIGKVSKTAILKKTAKGQKSNPHTPNDETPEKKNPKK